MKSGFQKRKDRDSRQRAAIAAKSRKMTYFFEEDHTKVIDHTKVDEFSICLRYVLKYGQIAERFISFQQLEDSKSETMYHKILSTIQTLGLDIAYVVAKHMMEHQVCLVLFLGCREE